MLEKFEHFIYGNTIGVLTFVLSEVGEAYEQLTVFKAIKNTFYLISNSNSFTKSDVEKIDTLVTVFIINEQKYKVFGVKDSIDKSLFEKTLSNSFNMSWINFSDRIVSNQIDENQFLKLKKLKDRYLKDHHFLAIGYLGIENLKQLNLIEIPDIQDLISQNKHVNYKLEEEEFDLVGLNSLGIIASIFSQKQLNTKLNLRIDNNVLKSFAKRILFKMVPVVLVIMVLNYFYVNKLTADITESQYELSLIENIIGEKQISQELKNEDLKYFDQLSSSLSVQRTHIINDLINCHELGITYLKIIVDPSNVKRDNMFFSKGTGSIWFETKDTDLIDPWEQRIRNRKQFYNVELIELNTDHKGLSKGYISFVYE